LRIFLTTLFVLLALQGCDQASDSPAPVASNPVPNTNTVAPLEDTMDAGAADESDNTLAIGAAQPAVATDTAEQPDSEPEAISALPAKPRQAFKPAPGTSWQWQISGVLNTGYEVDVYDIDLFDTPEETIRQLQARGSAVICYFSAGTYEEWRVDAANFDAAILGKPLGDWPGERWIDIRASATRSIMSVRLDLAQLKGCDAVEPDNVDAFTHDTGFPLTPADQLQYAKWLADEAHSRNLSIGLKNNLGQLKALEPWYDFAVNEQCSLFAECLQLRPFIAAGKAVFRAEYDPTLLEDATLRKSLCQVSNQAGHSTLILPRLLNDRFRFDCLANP